jgi:RNA-directed DNA polymerase
MKMAEKYQHQMYLPGAGEWFNGGRPVEGTDVFCKRSRKVSKEWLSEKKKERALTEDLMSEVFELSNFSAAARQVIKNGGSPGIDGMTTKELEEGFMGMYQRIIDQLKTGTYKPATVLGVEIPKANGGIRLLGIPTVQDRMVQQAISQVLSRRYERIFSDHSYGFRPGRNAHQGLKQAGQYVKEGYTYVVDLDLEKFFDKVNHDRLMSTLGGRISDKRLLDLIRKFLRTGILIGGLENQRITGTPQGSPLSPLLSNIVLDELDKELERRGHRFVRYADDQIILVKSEASAQRVLKSITCYIQKRMLLKVNEEKSRICRPYELNFLGHRILFKGELGLSCKSEHRFKEKLRQITRRNRGISLEQLVKELNPVLRGWLSYFRNAKMKSKLAGIESWLQRKVRCFRLKQCKRASGIIKFLTGLGVPKWRSLLLAVSHKGWYRKSGTPQANEGMSKKWFAKIGLFTLTGNYC